MRRVKSIIIYTILFLGLVWFFAPKLYFYYALEKQLESQNIKISQEAVSDQGFSLKVSDGNLYYADLLVGQFETLSLLPVVLFNSLRIENFKFSDDMSRFAKGKLEKVNVTYHILTPLTIHVNSHADMGDMSAEVQIKDRNISLHFLPSEEFLKQPPFWLNKMKKSDEGGYFYETAF